MYITAATDSFLAKNNKIIIISKHKSKIHIIDLHGKSCHLKTEKTTVN